MAPNPLNKLSAEERATVTEITQRTAAQVFIDSHDLEPLFAAWEKMFPGDNQRITCRQCVAYVVSNFRRYVKDYREQSPEMEQGKI